MFFLAYLLNAGIISVKHHTRPRFSFLNLATLQPESLITTGIYCTHPSLQGRGLTIQMRHQGVPEDIFAPNHLTLGSTGTQAHPKSGGVGSGFEVMFTLGGRVLWSLSLLLSRPNTPGSHSSNTELTLTTGLAGRTPYHQCSCHHRQSVRPAAQSQSRRC